MYKGLTVSLSEKQNSCPKSIKNGANFFQLTFHIDLSFQITKKNFFEVARKGYTVFVIIQNTQSHNKMAKFFISFQMCESSLVKIFCGWPLVMLLKEQDRFTTCFKTCDYFDSKLESQNLTFKKNSFIFRKLSYQN